jgi:hypothetical protein
MIGNGKWANSYQEFDDEFANNEPFCIGHRGDRLSLYTETADTYTLSEERMVESITPIKSKYLPEHLQFGNVTVYSNKVYWDGNTNGKETTNVVDGDTWYCMSHQCPDVDELLAGGLIYVEGEPEPGPFTNLIKKVGEDIDGWYRFNDMIYFCCNDVEYKGNILNKGIYIPNRHADKKWALEFSNFNGFESIGTKTLDPKYLPSGGGVMRVNVTYTGVNESTMQFTGMSADKTYQEIYEHIQNGGFVFMCVVIDEDTFLPMTGLTSDSISFGTTVGGAGVYFDVNKRNEWGNTFAIPQ